MPYKMPCNSDCPCEVPVCETCNGYDNLFEFATDYGFDMEQTPDSEFPLSYSGSSLTGITVIPGSVQTVTVQTDGPDTYLAQNGCSNTGAPYADDDIVFTFNGVAKRNFTFSYEYYLDAVTCPNGGKHALLLSTSPSSVTGAGMVIMGSWSAGASETIAWIGTKVPYPSVCTQEYPPAEIPNFNLPQAPNVWRTRTLVKDGPTIEFTDGDYGPTLVESCWLNLPGYVGMYIGPGVRIRNINISL